MLVNGQPNDCVHAEDRGLSYGDGVFRTLRIRNGLPLNWKRHADKLRRDCSALALDCPADTVLLNEIKRVAEQQETAVVKIIVTRGRGQRGYAIPATRECTRVVDCQPFPQYPPDFWTAGVSLHVCNIRLGHQPALAGIKHLNRLENVLAASECRDAGKPEGLLLDEAGDVIGGTRSNLFMVRDGRLLTPELGRCGVAGVQRERVISWAEKHHIVCTVGPLQLADLQTADEIFLVNSVFGLWSIREFPGYFCTQHLWSNRIRNALAEEEA
ncbi:aminodeoxychorismate lyase [Ferrigenium sp. UT5]|uniref:aminodeoxychorismate lyase n=1 Tax=Ferrigenium sp. UT5 TaxID=3242105 RepID=UPI0035519D07